PVLGSLLLSKKMRELPNPIWRLIQRLYHGFFVRVVNWPRLTLGLMLPIIVSTFFLFPRLGGEFLPKLEEGNIWVRATMPLTISFQDGAQLANRMRRALHSFPEVDSVVSQMGRPDSGTETTGFFNVELAVDLKPAARWPQGLSKPDLVQKIDRRLTEEMPG